MPETGAKVTVYFPNIDESQAIAVSCLGNKNNEDCVDNKVKSISDNTAIELKDDMVVLRHSKEVFSLNNK